MDRWKQISSELNTLRHKASQIHALYTVKIFSEPMTEVDYNSRSRLRDAKVTIALADDKEYQSLIQRIYQLEAERDDIRTESTNEFERAFEREYGDDLPL